MLLLTLGQLTFFIALDRHNLSQFFIKCWQLFESSVLNLNVSEYIQVIMALEEGVQLSVMNSIQEVSFVVKTNTHYWKKFKISTRNRMLALLKVSSWRHDLRFLYCHLLESLGILFPGIFKVLRQFFFSRFSDDLREIEVN